MGLLATIWALLWPRKTKPVVAATKSAVSATKPEGLKEIEAALEALEGTNRFMEYLKTPEQHKQAAAPAPAPAHANSVPLCALVVGHSFRDGGAVSHDGRVSEYEFNMPLAQMIAAKVPASRCRVMVMTRQTVLPALVEDLNRIAPDFAIELHCNAADGHASGTEMLYGDLRPKAEVMARIIQRHVVAALKLPDRGVKARKRAERGGYLLHTVNAPAVIAESFFIDNPQDLARARDATELAKAYAQAITSIAMAVLTREEGPEQ